MAVLPCAADKYLVGGQRRRRHLLDADTCLDNNEASAPTDSQASCADNNEAMGDAGEGVNERVYSA